MRAIAGLWRWRHNALRRTTDLVESWVALVALVLILVAAPLIGSLTASATHDALHTVVHAQHEQRHRIKATVVSVVPQPPVDPDPETATERDASSQVVASWTAPNGSPHTETVFAALRGPEPGDRFALWTDASGKVVARPMDGATATAHAVLAGIGAAAATGGLIEGARRLAQWRLVRLRYDQWDREWAKVGPDWGRTGTGS